MAEREAAEGKLSPGVSGAAARKVARHVALGERWTVADSKTITEATTLAELREQLNVHEVIALRIYPPVHGEAPREASLHHKTGFHLGTGETEAAAINAAFSKLRRTLLGY